MRSNLKVASNDSYVYKLTVSAKTPQSAKAIVDNLATRLVDTMRSIDRGSAEDRRMQLAKLRDDKGRDLENIEEQLRDLQARNHVASLPDELTEATSRASHFQREQADATADLHEIDAKLAELTARAQVLTPEVASAGRGLSETARPSRLSPNDYTRLTSDKLDAQVRSRGLSAKLASTDRSYVAASARLQVLAEVQAKYDFLSARLAAAKRDYAALSDAYEEAVIETTAGQPQLHLQAQATALAAPISPIKIYHVGAAGALALVIALGLAYVFDYFEINLFLPPTGGELEQRVSASIPAAETPASASAGVVLEGGQAQ